jgi:Fic family protein
MHKPIHSLLAIENNSLSCVFHYEFEFIRPFQEGNGRMGRLWQTVILKEWKEIFAWLPVETLIKENRKECYSVFGTSDSAANSTKFIEFMHYFYCYEKI